MRPALLELIRDTGHHTLILSPFILAELERVLNYPRLQTLWPLDPLEIANYIQALQNFGECVLPGIPQAVVALDPADDPVLATAVAGQADVLCTLDRHFGSPVVVEYSVTATSTGGHGHPVNFPARLKPAAS